MKKMFEAPDISIHKLFAKDAILLGGIENYTASSPDLGDYAGEEDEF